MDRSPRLQVVVAHPDDETFGCGSLLLHAKSSGAVTTVCCATRGEEGGAAAASDLAAVRERELHEAAAVLEVDTVRLLDFADSGMSGTLPPHALCAADFGDVVASLRAEIDAFGPDVVVTLDAGDGHRDHARIRDAAIAAARDAEVPRVYLLCLPRSLMQRWIDQMRVDHPDTEYLDAETSTLGTPDDDITTIIDVTEHLARRQRAINAHTSQTSPFEGLPDDLTQAFLAAVHARRVEPPWLGGDLETDLFG